MTRETDDKTRPAARVGCGPQLFPRDVRLDNFRHVDRDHAQWAMQMYIATTYAEPVNARSR